MSDLTLGHSNATVFTQLFERSCALTHGSGLQVCCNNQLSQCWIAFRAWPRSRKKMRSRSELASEWSSLAARLAHNQKVDGSNPSSDPTIRP